MTRAFKDDEIRKYLLGGMTDREEQEIEMAFFRDAELLARVELARDDLADDYAAGRLAAGDRQQFERHVLSGDEGRRQMAITRALRNTADARSKGS